MNRKMLWITSLVVIFCSAAWSQTMIQYGALGANSAAGTSGAANSAANIVNVLNNRLAGLNANTSSGSSAPGQASQSPTVEELMRSNRRTLEQGALEHGAMLHAASVPQGAMLYVDHRAIARTPADLRLPAGKHILELKSPAFMDWKQEVSVAAEEKLTIEPKLQADTQAQNDKRIINLAF